MKQNLLEQVPEDHSTLIAWLDENADELYDAISRGLRESQTMPQAVNRLLLVFPRLLIREDLKRWGKLLREAQKLARQNVPEESSVIQQIYSVIPQDKNFRPTKRRRRERMDARELLEAYLTLMMAQIYQPTSELTQERLNDMLYFARSVNNPQLYHKMYQTLAFILIERGEYERALDYARLTYEYWASQNQFDDTTRMEIAQTAHALAGAYRGMQEFDKASHWMEFSVSKFAEVNAPKQHAVTALELGCLFIWQQQNEVAKQWFQEALKEAHAEDMPFYIALTYHYLAMAQVYDSEPGAAYDNALKSINAFEAMEDLVQLVHVEHTMSYIEARLGKRNEAIERIHRNLERMKSLPNSPRKAFHEDKFKTLLETLEGSGNIDELNPYR